MYNRYIPQSDGSYKRRPCKDSSQTPGQNSAASTPRCTPPAPPISSPPASPTQKLSSRERAGNREPISAGNFLRNLLPGDFDTGDLMILLLLLLIAGDCPEDRNNAWLTLALYFFL